LVKDSSIKETALRIDRTTIKVEEIAYTDQESKGKQCHAIIGIINFTIQHCLVVVTAAYKVGEILSNCNIYRIDKVEFIPFNVNKLTRISMH
jgi:hypothetical protein